MRFIAQVLFVAVLALALGLGGAYYATYANVPFATVKKGAWYAHPNIGKPDIDAYTLAHLSASGKVPLAVVDGLAFEATTDDTGQALNAHCDYILAGNLDAVPIWTIALTDQQGRNVLNPAQRYVFSSEEAMRNGNSEINITVSSQASGQDWLPAPESGYFTLHLRLYDVPVNAFSERQSRMNLPRIERRHCR